MWLAYVAGVLVVFAIIAAALGGGVFTIVLVPLAVIAIVAAVSTTVFARLTAGDPPGAPDPRSEAERLVELRQQHQ